MVNCCVKKFTQCTAVFTFQMDNFTLGQLFYTSSNFAGCDKYQVCLAASIKKDTALFVYCVCMHKKIETGFSHVFDVLFSGLF